ncbi:hypothetical protein PPGU19_075220 (plasmid) [Paraburkholderia sp. PGU19]|nr:hypothetical protein PPGU19_075220 [Paraburkholderia sp. PGU19]
MFRVGVIQFISYSLLTNAMYALRKQGYHYRYAVQDRHTEYRVEMLRGRARLRYRPYIARTLRELQQEILYTQRAAFVAV